MNPETHTHGRGEGPHLPYAILNTHLWQAKHNSRKSHCKSINSDGSDDGGDGGD